MTTASERLPAVQAYQSGLAFFQDGNYGQAIIELHKAEEAFSRLWSYVGVLATYRSQTVYPALPMHSPWKDAATKISWTTAGLSHAMKSV